MTTPFDDENVNFNVGLNGEDVIAALNEINKSASSTEEKIKLLQTTISTMAAKAKVDLNSTLAAFIQLDNELANRGSTSALFGNNNPLESWNKVNSGLEDIVIQEKVVGSEAQTMGEEGAVAAERMTSGINLLRVALGTLEAMFIFNVLQAITTTFTNAIGYANQYYNALFQISVAQDVLARGGMNITQQQLVDQAKQLESEWKIISDADATMLVAQTALLTKNLGLSVEQMKLLGDYAVTLSIQQTGSAKDAQANLEQLVRSLQSGSSSAALEKIGVGFKAADVEAEALQLHLIQQGQALDDNSRALAAFSLIQQGITPEMQKMSGFAETLPGTGAQADKAWSDFLKDLGLFLDPVILKFKGLFGDFITNIAIPAVQALTKAMAVSTAAFIADINVMDDALHGHIQTQQEYRAILESNIQYYERLFSFGGISPVNTPTGTPATTTPSVDTKKISSSMDTFFKDVVQFQDQVQKSEEDYNLKLKNMRENYQAQRQKTIEDYNNSVSKEKQNYRLKEEQQTQAHYTKLRDLQNNYLFDLEEALRQRDALAVLKLEAKYNLEVDKENTSFKQQQANDAKNEALRLAQMKKDEELRLKQEADAYALQQKQAQEAYNLQMEQMKRANIEKLQELAATIAQELGITQQGADAIYRLLLAYYGPNGAFDGLYNYSYQSLIARSQQFLSALQQITAQYSQIASSPIAPSRFGFPASSMAGTSGQTAPSSPSYGSYGGYGGSIGRRAGGGVDFANSATNLTFGEAGPEMAITVPLGGASASPTFSGFGGGQQGGGLFHVLVEMNPGLVGKIIEQSMNATAEVVTRVNRSS